MNKFYYFLLLTTALVLFVSCESNTKKIPTKGKFTEEIKNEDGSFTQRKYSDGVLKMEYRINKDNKKDGQELVYYPSGKLHSKFMFKDGKQEGESVWYYESGKPYDVKNYVDNEIQGIRKTFYDDGKIKSEQNFIASQPQPGLKEYANNGKLLKQPELIITTKNRVAYENKYIIYGSFSSKIGTARYYQYFKNKGNNSIELFKKDNVGFLELYVNPGEFLMEDITIRAETKTSFRNQLVVEKTIRVAVENR